MTAGLWFSAVDNKECKLSTCSQNIPNFVPQKPILEVLRDFKTYLAIEMSLKKSIKHMASYRGVKLLKAKGQETKKRMANVQKTQTIGVVKACYTQSRTFCFCIFFVLFSPIAIAVAATPILFNCSSCVFIMATIKWSNHYDHVWREHLIFHSWKAVLVERVEKLKSFQK